MPEITFRSNEIPSIDEIISVFEGSGIKRPTKDRTRIEKMFAHANLIVGAYDGEKLVGLARSLTDFCYCCYLSDLAVRREYQHLGIGKRLIEITRELAGEHSNLLLLSAPEAETYYPKVGFQNVENGFIIKRIS